MGGMVSKCSLLVVTFCLSRREIQIIQYENSAQNNPWTKTESEPAGKHGLHNNQRSQQLPNTFDFQSERTDREKDTTHTFTLQKSTRMASTGEYYCN
ncbi:hypothetical protein DPMN_171244 [Dreissena polymorpha]|uniref:Ig-like domain-containing protein n=1 Tax=Dreissena polymorpha TaxID=45954 RepID=A0A9D4E0S8_DREPO|nr:hypothetical protein DPMN_171244 [Dreissena polymorpha]